MQNNNISINSVFYRTPPIWVQHKQWPESLGQSESMLGKLMLTANEGYLNPPSFFSCGLCFFLLNKSFNLILKEV